MADYIKNCTNLEYFSPGWIWIRCKFVISQILFLFFHILPYIYITKHHILIVKFKGICSWIKVQVRIHWKDNRWMYCHVSTYTLYICSTTAIASYRLLLCTSSLSTSPSRCSPFPWSLMTLIIASKYNWHKQIEKIENWDFASKIPDLAHSHAERRTMSLWHIIRKVEHWLYLLLHPSAALLPVLHVEALLHNVLVVDHAISTAVNTGSPEQRNKQSEDRNDMESLICSLSWDTWSLHDQAHDTVHTSFASSQQLFLQSQSQ